MTRRALTLYCEALREGGLLIVVFASLDGAFGVGKVSRWDLASVLRRKSSVPAAEPSAFPARRADAGIVEAMSRRRNAAGGAEGRRMGCGIYDAVH